MNGSNMYKSLNKFVMRMPLLPIEFYKTAHNKTRLEIYNEGELISKQYKILIKNSILVASKGVYDKLNYSENYNSNLDLVAQKINRYLIRMSTRPTPYGLFSGISVGNFSDISSVTFNKRTINYSARPNTIWFLDLINKLEINPKIIKSLKLHTNPTIIKHSGRIYEIENIGLERSLNMVHPSINATTILSDILENARIGRNYKEITNSIWEKNNISDSSIRKAIVNLIMIGMISTNLRPSLTETDLITELLSKLENSNSIEKITIKKIKDLFHTINKDQKLIFKNDFERIYSEICSNVKRITGRMYNDMIHIDSYYKLSNLLLSNKIKNTAEKAAKLMLEINGYKEYGLLQNYKKKFYEKYGKWREIPLLELMDENIGLGSPYTKLNPLHPKEYKKNINLRNKFLMNLISEALAGRRTIIKLSDDDVSYLSKCYPKNLSMPYSLDIILSILNKSESDTEKFRVEISPSTGKIGAGSSFSRFSTYNSDCKNLLANIKRHEIEHYKKLNIIPAEIMALPTSNNVANVSIKPQGSLNYVALGVETDGSKIEIPLSDLVIGLRNNRFYVKWVHKNSLVHFANTGMTNIIFIPDTLRFLINISEYGHLSLERFDWGHVKHSIFLPRLEYKNIIISPAQCQFDKEVIDKKINLSSEELFSATLNKWLSFWNMPQYIYLAEKDKRLLIDRRSKYHIKDLYKEFKSLGHNGNTSIILQEAFFEEQAIIKINGKHYTQEVTVPLILNSKTSSDKTLNLPNYIYYRNEDRLKYPFSEWVSVLFYLSEDAADNFLKLELYNLIKRMTKNDGVRSWFFIKYTDPRYHIRLRLNCSKKKSIEAVIKTLSKFGSKAVFKGLCNDFSISTYEREIERYGGLKAMELSEQLFFLDSVIVLYLFKNFNPNEMMLLAVITADILLENLGVPDNTRIKLYNKWSPKLVKIKDTSFKSKLNYLIQLRKDYLYNKENNITKYINYINIATRQSIHTIGMKLHLLDKQNELNTSLDNLFNSYLHMHFNRILGTSHDYESEARILLKRSTEILLHGNKDNKN